MPLTKMEALNKYPWLKALIPLIAAVGAILIVIFQQGFASQPVEKLPQDTNPAQSTQSTDIDVTSKPDLTTNPTLLPTQPIEITFSQSLENEGEFKHDLTPKTDYKIEISGDRKTVKIIPTSSYILGAAYNLTIYSNTKIQGGKELGKELHFNFQTIKYQGV